MIVNYINVLFTTHTHAHTHTHTHTHTTTHTPHHTHHTTLTHNVLFIWLLFPNVQFIIYAWSKQVFIKLTFCNLLTN